MIRSRIGDGHREGVPEVPGGCGCSYDVIAVQHREELKEKDRGIERESLDAIRKYLKISHAVNFNKDISGDCQLPHGECLKHHQLQQTKEYLSSGEREYREELC